MIVRIVKLSFETAQVDLFLAHFAAVESQIRSTKGNMFLELYRDIGRPNVFFTYSHWSTEQDLENYRNSDFFKTVWAATKAMFNDKPQAWTCQKN